MSDQIQVTRTVDAAPEQLFALLATPSRHTEMDGSGMMRGLQQDPGTITGTGDTFIMNMNNDALGDYAMKSTVVAFEQDRKIGWSPAIHPADGYTDKLGDTKVGGHSYTWELQPEGSGTKVTQTYDWSAVTDENFRGFFPMLTEDQLTDSIDRAAAVAR